MLLTTSPRVQSACTVLHCTVLYCTNATATRVYAWAQTGDGAELPEGWSYTTTPVWGLAAQAKVRVASCAPARWVDHGHACCREHCTLCAVCYVGEHCVLCGLAPPHPLVWAHCMRHTEGSLVLHLCTNRLPSPPSTCTVTHTHTHTPPAAAGSTAWSTPTDAGLCEGEGRAHSVL